MKNTQNDENAKEAKRILDRVERDSETAGFSSIARVAEKTRDGLVGKASDEDDPIEQIGKKIGRTLSIIAVIVLGYYLLSTYFV